MKRVCKVLYPTDTVKKVDSIFLAGTIDMGNSIDWQQMLIDEVSSFDVTVYNPRRKEWDSSWEQVKDNPKFNHQVTWELECLEKSDMIVMYLAENSKSPISMIELGLHLKGNDKLVIYCPSGFYRKGNIDITSSMYNSSVYESFEDLVSEVKRRLDEDV